MPIVRTFITVVAGVGKMDYRIYTTYSVIGGILWGVGVTVLGYSLGGVDFVRDNIEVMLLLDRRRLVAADRRRVAAAPAAA